MQHTLTQRSHTRYLYHLNNFVSTATAAVATTVAREGKKIIVSEWKEMCGKKIIGKEAKIKYKRLSWKKYNQIP